MRYRTPTIREKGLKVHLTELGVDYELFVRLARKHVDTANIGRAIDIASRQSIKSWREIDKEEHPEFYKSVKRDIVKESVQK